MPSRRSSAADPPVAGPPDAASTDGARDAVTATVTATDIARLAGVGRAAVSNWRRRFGDFPQPVGGTSTSPLFALTAVEDWFGRHDRPFHLAADDRVWQLVRGAVDDPRLGELLGHLGGFLVAHRRDRARATALLEGNDPVVASSLARAIEQAVPELPDGFPGAWEPDWVPIARSAAQVADLHGHAELFDALRGRYREVYSRQVAQLPPAVAALMVSLAGLRGGGSTATVLDPACGVGGLLEAARAAGAGRLLGQDISPTAARVSAVGLLLRGAPMRVVAADSLLADAFADERADVVLCRPPFGQRSWGYDDLLDSPWWAYGVPPRGEPELAWVQHCLAHARVGASVLVIMPAAAASRRAGRRIRVNLLRGGALRAVLGLPPELFTTGSPPDLWVLRGPEPGEAPSEVLMGLAATDLATDVAGVEAAWSSWCTAEAGDPGSSDDLELPPGFRRVPTAELLDDEVDVSPRRHVEVAAPVPAVRRFPAVREDLLAALTSLPSAVPLLVEAAGAGPAHPPVGRSTTVDDLAKAAALTILTAPLRTRAGGGDLPLLTAHDVRLGRRASGRTGDLPGMLRPRPGDVVCAVGSGEIAARVVDEVGIVLGPRVMLLRVDADQLDPYFLAGSLRAAGHRGGGRSGPGEDDQLAGRSGGQSLRSDLRRIRIPALPLAEQRTRGAEFERLARAERSLRDAVELGDEIVRLGYLGIADGSLRSRDNPGSREC